MADVLTHEPLERLERLPKGKPNSSAHREHLLGGGALQDDHGKRFGSPFAFPIGKAHSRQVAPQDAQGAQGAHEDYKESTRP